MTDTLAIMQQLGLVLTFHDDHTGRSANLCRRGGDRGHPLSAGDYIRAVLDQRRTLEPDRLEIARRDGRQSQPAVMLVDNSTTLTDGTRELKFYHTPNAHSSGTLVGYVPDARVVFTADLVSDTFPLNPALASAVHELIKENGLSVEMITCAHGNDHVLCSICLCAREVSGHEHATPILKQVG